jgi:hypothetical protein
MLDLFHATLDDLIRVILDQQDQLARGFRRQTTPQSGACGIW